MIYSVSIFLQTNTKVGNDKCNYGDTKRKKAGDTGSESRMKFSKPNSSAPHSLAGLRLTGPVTLSAAQTKERIPACPAVGPCLP